MPIHSGIANKSNCWEFVILQAPCKKWTDQLDIWDNLLKNCNLQWNQMDNHQSFMCHHNFPKILKIILYLHMEQNFSDLITSFALV